MRRGWTCHAGHYAYIAALARERIQRLGVVGPHRLWTSDEEELLLSFGDYRKAFGRIPGRTSRGIQVRAKKLGMGLTRSSPKPWTPTEIRVLRRIYPTGTKQEVRDGLPGRNQHAIYVKANALRLRKRLRPPGRVGVKLYDQIRRRAFDMNISMKDLDDATGLDGFFGRRREYDLRVIKVLQKAMDTLGGRLVIEWEDVGFG
ncbi:hypothetical protein [Alsobacter sp. SYSU BS001988]